MADVENTKEQASYWSERYKVKRTGWDIGAPSTPLKSYIDQLEDKKLKILIPGAGNAYEAEYLHKIGFQQVYIMDIAIEPLDVFRQRVPDFPESQIIHSNFFDHQGQYDIILEQTFFCSFLPTTSNRALYAKKTNELLSEKGKLVGLWFDIPLIMNTEKRPFGGNKELYLSFLNPYFEVKVFEKCYNSIQPRANTELFGIFIKKDIQ